MVFNVRCFKCGAHDVRLVLGGRAIIHARCHSCDTNLLAEVMALEEEAVRRRSTHRERQITSTSLQALGSEETDVPDTATSAG
ncbi:hypothetical protein DV096_06745 [Bradymonadaceae bacterium TMQ3]|uniref:Com family DNA-binding transcriptional regulator n=1 Tax=Lujinxingia sediminis TaxID=2480984 RepID=A0ABY0CRC4_9DELT|nr:hypothetical protein [Lujinxingia sediminis]RDV38511.1 hypothetical protein DV096_06745 [Bradymonadaceae bacterium TMQ3]RVU42671.1 hypothetical protein EA187_15905 [Lujinxingia sediminis]TXC76721.1 hypothetical protein FRC91_08320 [Bradymonadales bacterium TMQ1]